MHETIGKYAKLQGKPCKQAVGKSIHKSSREEKTSEYHLGQMLKGGSVQEGYLKYVKELVIYYIDSGIFCKRCRHQEH